MRILTLIGILFLFLGSAQAVDLGSRLIVEKGNTHVGQNPGTPDGREGGETFATAVNIDSLPYSDTGNTSDNSNDHDADCVYGVGNSPDVIYTYTPPAFETISVDLCGSGFDTRISIMLEDETLVICNDDFYFDDECGLYTSKIEEAQLEQGITYYIMVDGYNGDSGDYVLEVQSVCQPEPCILSCDGTAEGEPSLQDGYVDEFNSGCGNHGPGSGFQALQGDQNGDLVFCGASGWYETDSQAYRDTDWFTLVVGPTGQVEWTLDAEEEAYGYLLGPNDCNDVSVLESITVGPCAPGTLVLTGEPGEVIWVWVGPTTFAAPGGFVGNEFAYVSTFSGLELGTVETQACSFDQIKSIYR